MSELTQQDRQRLLDAGFRLFCPRPLFPETAAWIHKDTRRRLTMEEAWNWCREQEAKEVK